MIPQEGRTAHRLRRFGVAMAEARVRHAHPASPLFAPQGDEPCTEGGLGSAVFGHVALRGGGHGTGGTRRGLRRVLEWLGSPQLRLSTIRSAPGSA
ncbi:hypothetical protein ACFU8W_02480 [Streptomyces sp. NPDC057565]|uniref:hypothetical protein n=1 Tax=Streptomyces sp. NPDC057565 TaxID=3346169 RepID=UPI0036A491FB